MDSEHGSFTLKKNKCYLVYIWPNISALSNICLTGKLQCFQVEKNYLNGKLKAITAYYFRQDGC